MTDKPVADREKLRFAGEVAQAAMEDILSCFKPGAKITVLVRTPSHPDGSRDFLMTNDDLDAVISAVQIRRNA